MLYNLTPHALFCDPRSDVYLEYSDSAEDEPIFEFESGAKLYMLRPPAGEHINKRTGRPDFARRRKFCIVGTDNLRASVGAAFLQLFTAWQQDYPNLRIEVHAENSFTILPGAGSNVVKTFSVRGTTAVPPYLDYVS
jgi:hypothetical protein